MYKINFSLMHIHKYSLTELENMLPFEREIYLVLLNQHIEKEKERIAKEQSERDAQFRKLTSKAKRRG